MNYQAAREAAIQERVDFLVRSFGVTGTLIVSPEMHERLREAAERYVKRGADGHLYVDGWTPDLFVF